MNNKMELKGFVPLGSVVLLEGATKNLTYKIPGTNKELSIGGSASISAGASGHVSSKKESFSIGGKVGMDPGFGVELEVKDK